MPDPVSVANLTRDDRLAFMRVAAETHLAIETTTYPLAQANRALGDLRDGRLTGAAVLSSLAADSFREAAFLDCGAAGREADRA